MDSDKYLEGKSMQRPPLYESDHFLYWKNRFETYVKAKDLDIWHIILNGDFPPLTKNEVTQILKLFLLKNNPVGIKSLLDAVWITAAYVCVNAAQLELVLLRDFKENMLSVYYC
ncbi:hypothetical protein Tco_0506225 [Tanacetum coccineum]